jgi:hypothetical protein
MAAGAVVTCPECEKKFKPKSDVAGKKIKCPFCTKTFVVPEAQDAKAEKPKSEAKSGKPTQEAKAAAEPAAASAPDADADDNPDPYGVKTVEIVPRCPNCTKEMGEHDIICLACGYNTMTREWGKTEKTLGITFERQFFYLLPAIGAASFVFFSIIFLFYFFVASPYDVDKTMFEFTDSEPIRMWSALIFLSWLWGAGMFCFKKFVEKPLPDEIQMEENEDDKKKKKEKEKDKGKKKAKQS